MSAPTTFPSPSQTYLSTRGGSEGLSFRDVVLKGLAPDGGLFVPSIIPSLPSDWQSRWSALSFQDLAFEIMSLYICRSEIPADDLRSLIAKSYSTFRDPAGEVTPLVKLDKDRELYLLELFHGPTFAFKDVALQFLGNLFEYFLGKMNEGKEGPDRMHLTVIGATSGDTGSAAIYGLRGKKDVSIFILYPDGRISPIQEAQMTTVLDPNVHCLAVQGSFDDCQDTVKALFANPTINSTHTLAAVNSINWARILAQITYYFASYFALARTPGFDPATAQVRYVVPSGNFGDILAGWFASRMGLPVSKLVIGTNENDILDRFFKNGGEYRIQLGGDGSGAPGHKGAEVEAKCEAAAEAKEEVEVDDDAQSRSKSIQHPDPVRPTHSPAMDILVSSNFERLLWFLAFETATAADLSECGLQKPPPGADGTAPMPVPETSSSIPELTIPQRRAVASARIRTWLSALKSDSQHRGFTVTPAVFALASREFESERVSNEATIGTIRHAFASFAPPGPDAAEQRCTRAPVSRPVILDPHTAVGVCAALRSMARTGAEVGGEHEQSSKKEEEEKKGGVYHIALATAHPAKFAAAVDEALTGQDGVVGDGGEVRKYSYETMVQPAEFVGLEEKEKKVIRVPRAESDLAGVRAVICREVEREGRE